MCSEMEKLINVTIVTQNNKQRGKSGVHFEWKGNSKFPQERKTIDQYQPLRNRTYFEKRL